MRAALLLALCPAFLALPLAAQTPTEGAHRCMIWDAYLGDIVIQGSQYAGPAYDGAFGDVYSFDAAGGTITWGGPLGGITEAGTVVSTVVTDAGNNQFGFDITIQNADGEFQTVSCYPT